jgi:hypothetical protein
MVINQHFIELLSNLTPTTAENASYASHRQSVESKLESYFNITYTMETGSFRSGTGVRFHTDLDILASVPTASQRDNSYNMLLAVKGALQERFGESGIYIRTPSVVCNFTGGKTIEVTPGYYQYQTSAGYNVYKIPDFGGGWQTAAPSAHIAYVNSVNNKLDKKVKHVIRLIKAIKHAQNIPISSFYLEMRVAKYCDSQTTIVYGLDVLYALNRLVGENLAMMQDPVGIAGYISPTSTEAQRVEALSKLTTARNRAEKAIEAEKAGRHTDALAWWGMVFDRSF